LRFKKIILLIIITLVITFFTTKLYASSNILSINVNSFGSTNQYIIDNNFENKNKDLLRTYLEEAKNKTLKLSELSDNFNASRNYNNVYYINNNPNKLIEVDYELYNMLDLSLKYQDKTDGYFDVSIGLIIDEWKKLIDRSEKNITLEEYKSKVKEIEQIPVIKDGIKLSKSDDKYYVLIKNGVKIDLGAIAKGYSIQVVDNYFKSQNLKYYRVEGSASSLNYGINGARKGNYYHIGVEHPYMIELYGYFKIKNKNLTTSGDTIQKNTLYGDFMHHIISPYSKRPENNYRIFTLITNDAAYGDALSTALFSMDESSMKKWTKENNVEYLAIKYDGEVISNIYETEFVQLNDKFDKKPDVLLSEIYELETIFTNNKNVNLEITLNNQDEIRNYHLINSELNDDEIKVLNETLDKIKKAKYKITNLPKELSSNVLVEDIKNLLNNLGYFVNDEKEKINDANLEIEFMKYHYNKVEVKDETSKGLSETLKNWLIISSVIILLGVAFYFVGKNQEES